MTKTWLSKRKLTINGLVADESRFISTLKDADGKIFTKGTSDFDGVTRLVSPGKKHFFEIEHPKTRIVIHHTVGYLSGDAAALTRKKVSTAYLIPRSGDTFELFDPKFWSYHLGRPPKGAWWGNKKESQQTIAIELSNFGPLRTHHAKPDILVDQWNFPYCMKSDTSFYVNSPFRNHQYYATYTDAQMKALDSLLLKLCRKFNIPHSFLPLDERLKIQEESPSAGILTHVNYRTDKKDVSTAFNWNKISGR